MTPEERRKRPEHHVVHDYARRSDKIERDLVMKRPILLPCRAAFNQIELDY
jgi:hypothetical protein